MPNFDQTYLSIEQLILDPNNFRFHDDPDFVTASERRFHEEAIQSRIKRQLRDDGLLELKNSILTNGFMPVEPLVVRNYPYLENSYLVIEGNRRVAALKWIQTDIVEGGIEVDESITVMLSQLPVVIVSHDEDDPAFYEALMGVRHVSGIKPWGGYQRAKLVYRLKDERNLESSEIADRLGMSTQEVNRRYRAYKVLNQMQDDEEFGEYAKPNMYALFYETVANPIIREWLGWDQTQSIFTNEEECRLFYDLITPNDPEEIGYSEPKLRTFSDIRELRYILPNEEAKEALLDPRRPFFDAVGIAKEEQISKAWTTKIRSAIKALEQIGYLELKNLNNEQVELLTQLENTAHAIISDHQKLTED